MWGSQQAARSPGTFQPRLQAAQSGNKAHPCAQAKLHPQKPRAITNEYWNLKQLVFRLILWCRCTYLLHRLSSSPLARWWPLSQPRRHMGYSPEGEREGTGKVRGDTCLKIGSCSKEQGPWSLSPTLFPECWQPGLYPSRQEIGGLLFGKWTQEKWVYTMLEVLRETAGPHPISQQAPPHRELLKSSPNLKPTCEQTGWEQTCESVL